VITYEGVRVMKVMRVDEYVKRGYGRLNNRTHKNQGIGIVNNPKGINGYTKRKVEGDEWV